MKMKTIWFVVILIVATTLIINFTFNKENEEFKPFELNVGDVFTGIEYKNTMYVINYALGDVTGDGENDMVLLLGEKEDVTSQFTRNADIVIYDTVNATFISAGIKKFEGESSKIILSDLTSDGVNDVVVSLENSDKDKNIRILTVKNDSVKEIFGVKENKGINFVGEVIDGMKAHVRCNKLNKELYIDISDRKSELVQEKKVDESGKVVCSNKNVTTSGFKTLELVELNGQNGIQTTQIIYAFDGTEIVDEITVIWKFEEGKWQVKEARGTRVGNLKL